jgi:hypothetical protein
MSFGGCLVFGGSLCLPRSRILSHHSAVMEREFFQHATVVMLVLTVVCLALNLGGWVRLLAVWRVVSGAQQTLSPRETDGLNQLTGLIRLEAGYFTLLLLYVLVYPGVLALWPIVFVVLYHWFGWVANEMTRTTARMVAALQRELTPASSFGLRVRRALVVIGALDAIEAAILVYVTIALGESLGRSVG